MDRYKQHISLAILAASVFVLGVSVGYWMAAAEAAHRLGEVLR